MSTIYYFTSFYNLSVEETWQKNKFNSDYLFETKRKAKVMKKILLTIFTAIILLSVLAGCNESDPQLSDNAAVTNKTEGTTDSDTTDVVELKESEIKTEDRQIFDDYVIKSKYGLSDGEAIYLCVKKNGSRQLRLMSVTSDGVAYELEDSRGNSFDADTGGTAELLKGSSVGEEIEMYFFVEEALEGYRIKARSTEDRIVLTECAGVSQKEMLSLELFPELEQHTITSVDKLDKYREIIGKAPYNFYFEIFGTLFLDCSEFGGMDISDIEVRFTTPICDNTSYVSFTVTDSQSATIPDGRYEWEIHGRDELYIKEREEQLDAMRSSEIYDTEAVKKLLAFFSASGQYNTPTFGKGEYYPGVKEYICCYYGENGRIAFDDYCRIAKEEFGITDFKETSPDKDGMVSAEKRITGEPAVAVAEVKENDDGVTVYMQIYSDKNCFTRAYSVAYSFSEDGKWLGYEIISMFLNKPHTLMSVPDDMTKQYEAQLAKDIYSSAGEVEYRDHIRISVEIPEYIEKFSNSSREFSFFGYSKDDEQYYRVIGDEKLLLIGEKYGIDYYYNEKYADVQDKTKGVTDSGCEYIMIESEYKPYNISTSHYSADVYIELNDKYILYLDMSYAASNRDSIIEIINSIKAVEK